MKVVIILSGGMDSTTLAYDLKNKKHELHALTFDYGQKHGKEIERAKRTCAKLNIPHTVIPFGEEMKWLISNSALTKENWDIPEGHYAAPNMKQTVVPNRNMIMLALATGYAISIDAEAVAYAAHAGDHAIYPDCRPEFAKAMSYAMSLCHFLPIDLKAPYMFMDKGDICKKGVLLNVPYEDTWTCYVGGEKPCGECGACRERAEAFAAAGVPDPLLGEI